MVKEAVTKEEKKYIPIYAAMRGVGTLLKSRQV